MKYIKISIIIIMIIFIQSTIIKANSNNINLALVDINKLLNKYFEIKGEWKKIKLLNKQAKKEIKIKQTKLNNLQKYFQINKNNLNKKEFKQKLIEIGLIENKLNQLIIEKNKDLKNLEKKLKTSALKKIFIFLEKIRKKKKIKLILNISEALSFDNKVNLTQSFITEMKKYFK